MQSAAVTIASGYCHHGHPILKPLMPRRPVNPDSLDEFPPVNFNKGIPDYTNVNLPISGDFPKASIRRGG